MNLEQIKEELRKVIALDEIITPEPWYYDAGNWQVESRNDLRPDLYRVGVCGLSNHDRDKADGSCSPYDAANDGAFIARSRTITPKMAKALLNEIEWLAAKEIWYRGDELYNRFAVECEERLETIITEWNS